MRFHRVGLNRYSNTEGDETEKEVLGRAGQGISFLIFQDINMPENLQEGNEKREDSGAGDKRKGRIFEGGTFRIERIIGFR